MNSPKVKVCGITREKDGKEAISLGATYLGFILYEKSIRAIGLEDFKAINGYLADGFRVVVDVHPELERVRDYVKAGFDFFQIHISEIHDDVYLNKLSDLVGFDRLWLAPKLPPGTIFAESLFQYSNTFLIDTFKENAFGGTGKTGDWKGFKQLRTDYSEISWILAGGLNAENIKDAIREAGPETIDLSSGVEASPGLKSPEKLRLFFENLRDS